MNDANGYAVYFFPNALEALGDAIRPYLQEGPGGPFVVCNEVDTAGAFVELTLQGTTREGKWITLELMVPSGMIKMIVSSQSEAGFGFGPRLPQVAIVTGLPPVGPTAEPAGATPEAVPHAEGEVAESSGQAASPQGQDTGKPAP